MRFSYKKCNCLRFFFLLAGTLLFRVSFAQNPQLAGVSYVFYPISGIKNKDKPAEFMFKEFGGFIKIPYKFKNDKTVMVNGIAYANVNSVISNASYNLEENEEILQVVYFQTIVAHKLPNNFNIVVSLRPTIASDFKEKISNNDFLMQGFVLLSKKKNENVSFGLGVANTMRLGKPFVLPIVPLHLKNNKHCIDGILPIKLNYIYCIDNKERFKVGGRGAINGGNINVATPYTTNYNDAEIDKINYSRANVGPVIYYNITKHIQIEAFGGISLRRQYNLLDVDKSTQKFYLKEVPFFQVGMFFVPSKRK